MAKRKKGHPLIENLHIESVAAEGKAMGRHDGMVVFVSGAVPGDVVDVQVRTKRRRFMEGYVTRWVERSAVRVEPFCEHFGVCGGCSWQNLPYEEQLRFKERQVFDQLVRIGHLEVPDVAPVLGSAATTFYRNKLEFTFAPRRWLTADELSAQTEAAAHRRSPELSVSQRREGVGKEGAGAGASAGDLAALGFHVPGMFDKILDVKKCWLQADPSNAIRLAVRRFCVEHGYEFYDIRAHSGLMRNVVIRTASTGEVTPLMT